MELHKAARATEEQISTLQQENANKVKGEAVVAAANVPARDANG